MAPGASRVMAYPAPAILPRTAAASLTMHWSTDWTSSKTSMGTKRNTCEAFGKARASRCASASFFFPPSL
eukprot:scaffold277_cov261-Pinguiococcus_pyrenoidosus.AAC.12